jgi:ABC-type nickel/cobalt efflux system permease component RcnA
MLSLVVILAIGFVLGMRHATDPDHVIAVSTIVTREHRVGRSALIGVAWGIGHTVTIFVVGTVLILFHVVIPPRVGLLMELAVGVMLILLGIYSLRAAFRSSAEHGHYHRHGDYVHAHASPAHDHAHAPAATPLGRLDRFFHRFTIYGTLRPLLVGIVHGLAGSAAVALLVLSTISNPAWGLLFLLIFGLGTVLGMTLITLAMASTFSYTQRRWTSIGRRFALAAGLISLVFGMVVTWQIVYGAGLFSGHPVWIAH